MIEKQHKYKAYDLIDLLLQKYNKDFFCVPECKTGATFTDNTMQKIDFWAMKKSWSNPITIGFEIKVSRSDFLNDNKWTNYLNYCTDFYFVCPPSLISVEELPPEVGLIVCSKNCKKLYTKKKAPSRQEVQIPESLYKYILMWRASPTNNRNREIMTKKEFWEDWLKTKEINKHFGYKVSRELATTIEERIFKVESKNKELLKINTELQSVKEKLKDLGFTKSDINYRLNWKLDEILKDRELGISKEVKDSLSNTIFQLERLKNLLNL